MLEDLKNQTQKTANVLPNSNAKEILEKLNDQEKDTSYRAAPAINAVHAYQAIAAPLDKLIIDLKSLGAQAPREDVVKQPDLDEAPPSYRSAVSDYFESMSRDYHPDKSAPDTKKP